MRTLKILLISICLLASINATYAQSLVNPNATIETLKLKSFLDSIYGKKIISGQMDDSYLQYIIDNTGGKSPVIMGYDFNGICPSQGGNNDAQKAIKWVKEKGGIAQFQWHWISPDANGDWSTKNYKLTTALNDTTSASYKNLIRDIDLVAAQIKIMQDAGVPILWRPLHEAEGAWFWWGMSGGVSCKKLWNIIYDRYTNFHKLNNIIWVWNSYGTSKANWYPGDSVVDIIAWDYPDYNPTTGSWSQYQKLFGNSGKLFGAGEDGKLTDPNLLESQPWLYFLTWAYMVKDPSVKDGKNPKDWLFQVYNDPRVLTLDDLTPGPKANAGVSQILIDIDKNGTENCILDASFSHYDSATDSIISYTWLIGDSIIGNGIKPEVTLPLGVHKITLTIASSDSLQKSAYVLVTVKPKTLSFNQTVKVSTTEAGFGNVAANAVDGNESTRWSSTYVDPQWIEVDLGKPCDIKEIKIVWEAASGKDYEIQESNNDSVWYTIRSLTNMAAGARVDTFKNLAGGARYIRIYGTKRNTTYGYSIWEFEVYGDENSNAKPVGQLVTGLETFNSPSIKIWPTVLNSNDILHIRSSNSQKDMNLEIFDLSGKLVINQKLKNNAFDFPISSNLSKGMYTVRISSNADITSAKFMIL